MPFMGGMISRLYAEFQIVQCLFASKWLIHESNFNA